MNLFSFEQATSGLRLKIALRLLITILFYQPQAGHSLFFQQYHPTLFPTNSSRELSIILAFVSLLLYFFPQSLE